MTSRLSRIATAGAAAAACVAMDACGGPTGRVLDLDTTDRYAEHGRWDDACHLLAGYAIGTTLAQTGADRRTVSARFLALTSAWELFEFAISERPWDGTCTTREAVGDTVLDTVMGTLGAFAAASVHADTDPEGGR